MGLLDLFGDSDEVKRAKEKIKRRRLQLLVHSNIYYDKNDSIIPDTTWNTWAQDLKELQEKYPNVAREIEYAEAFENFDPSTGYNLPYKDPRISNIADRLLKNRTDV